ncbi:AI-2E family transporter [soil metagenome]
MTHTSSITRNSLAILAAIACGASLQWGAAILTPLALAMFLMVMVDGLSRLLCRKARVPEWACLPLAIVLLLMLAGVVLWIVADNSVGFATQLLKDAPKINGLIGQIAGLFGVHVPSTLQKTINQQNPARYIGNVIGALQSFGAGAGAALIYLGFLLASRSGFRKKAYALFPDADDREHAAAVFVRIRDGIERYLWIQTVTGARIAVGCGVVMAVAGLNNAVFWAFLIFIAAYIPVVGGVIGGLLPPVFAMLQFGDPWRAGAIFAGIQVIMFIVGNVIQPRMQRDSRNIDPVVVLLALAFWGAVWGVPGMFLSTPLTVMMIIVLAQFNGSRWIAVLLSGDGAPETEPVLKRSTSSLDDARTLLPRDHESVIGATHAPAAGATM